MARVLLVGGGSGVGAVLARELVERGDKVLASVRTAEQVEPLTRDIPGLAQAFALDLSDADAIKARLDATLGGEPLDAVVVCAADSRHGPLETASLAELRLTLEINAVASLALYQALLPRLRPSRGRLIFLSSYAGKVSMPFLGLYQASKFALESLGDTMRQEAAPFGVKVVMILPGEIETAMYTKAKRDITAKAASLSQEEEALYGRFYRGFRGMVEDRSALMQPQEVSRLVTSVLDAADPEPRYVIGEGARFFIAQRETLSDRDMDRFVDTLFPAN